MKKFIRFLKDNKILVLAGLAVVALVIVMIYDNFYTQGPGEQPRFKTAPYEITQTQETTEETKEDTYEATTKLEVVDISPQGTVNTAYRDVSLYITFSEPVSTETVRVLITPPVQYKLYYGSSNKHIVWITPLQGWDYNTEYKLMVNRDVKSENGNILGKDFESGFMLNYKEEPENLLRDIP